MAEITNEKQQSGAGDMQSTGSTNLSEDIQQLTTTLTTVNLSSPNSSLIREIANHLKRTIQQFEESNYCQKIIIEYLKNTLTRILDDSKSAQNNEVVAYIFAPEDRNQLKRDRLNSCSVPHNSTTEVNTEDRQIELPSDTSNSTVHYCTDCEVEIPVIDGETLRAALLRHFTNDQHKPQPKPQPKPPKPQKAEIVLPTMSRKMAAMIRAEPSGKECDVLGDSEVYEEKLFETLNNVEPGRLVDAEGLIAVYKTLVTMLTTKVSSLDLSIASIVIAPIFVSIKDNVNLPSGDTVLVNNGEEETVDDAKSKQKHKTKRFSYQPIATMFNELLAKHKLVSLIDERGGHHAYFCIPCEFYTLRFNYETVVAHVLSDAHLHHLSETLAADGHISHSFSDTGTVEEIKKLNYSFLANEMCIKCPKSDIDPDDAKGYRCNLCGNQLSWKLLIGHIFSENHMRKLSCKFYHEMKEDESVVWGLKSTDWKKFNKRNGRPLSIEQPIALENFVKPRAKTLSQCQCCSLMVEGQRQLLFNHVRKKEHIRNVLPRRLVVAFSNFARPLEFFSSLGHFYTCTLCETFQQSVMLNFSDIFQHFESDEHVSVVAKLLRLYSGSFSEQDTSCLMRQGVADLFTCLVCGLHFGMLQAVIEHIFTDVVHQNKIAAREYEAYKPHIANYLLGSTPIAVINNNYHCMICSLEMTTISSLLTHLSFADHVPDKLQPEAIFRYYLLLKNNAKTCKDNSIYVRDQNIVECQKCSICLPPEENVRSHVASAQHNR